MIKHQTGAKQSYSKQQYNQFNKRKSNEITESAIGTLPESPR